MQTLVADETLLKRNTDPFLVMDNISKVYPTAKGDYTVLENISLTVYEGEFVCLIGHSGCGKSTLLNMVSGFTKPTTGEVRLQSKVITKPGPDRMVVFQNYSLLPWLSALDNVALAIKSVHPEISRGDRQQMAMASLEMVGLTDAAQKKPKQLSGGMKQRVSIARALSIRPQVLILDEPFGALDVLTREELQEELLKIWQENKVTVLMITHEIDEAILLADRIVMMTNGPAATIGEVVDIPFPRPRNREVIAEDPRFFTIRNHALDFLYNRFALSSDDH